MNHFKQAIEYYKNKEYQNAIDTFKLIINPSFNVYKNLGLLHTLINKSPIQYYELALQQNYDEHIIF